MEADLVISFKVFRETFVSRVWLFPEARRIETRYIDGPFKHMHSIWEFEEVKEGGCKVHFEVDFEFKNRSSKARQACSSTRRCNGSSAPSRSGPTSCTG